MEKQNMTKKKLYEIARKHNIPGRSKMSKKELISAIEDIETVNLTEKSVAGGDKGTSAAITNFPSDGINPEPEITLPEKYNVDTLVLLPINPANAFAFWEVTATTLAKYTGERDLSKCKLVLSFFISGENNSQMERIAFSPVYDIGNYYLNDSRINDSILWAELDAFYNDGKRINILTSAKIKMPSDKISTDTDTEFMQINEYSEKLLEYSIAGEKIIGSGEFIHRKMKMFSSYNTAKGAQ